MYVGQELVTKKICYKCGLRIVQHVEDYNFSCVPLAYSVSKQERSQLNTVRLE